MASRWIVGSGKRCSGPARSTRDEAVGDPVRLEVADEGEVGLGRVRAHEGRDQAGVDPAGPRGPPGAAAVASTTCRPVSPFLTWRSGAQRISA